MITLRRILLPLPLLFAATLLLAACSTADAPANTPGAAFYAELTFEVDLPPDDPHAAPGTDRLTTLVRWWYAPDPDRWRWEIETTGTILEDGIALTVFDGDETWTYDDASNAYQRAVYPTFPEGMIPSPSFSARLGPANLDSVEEFMQQLRDSSAVADVRLAGESTALNRRTQIVEIRPAWSSGSSATAIAPGSGQDVRPATQDTLTSGGVVRISIDPDRMFIMRSAVDGEGGGQSYVAEVTTLDYDAAIDPALFTFDPPPGAREVETTEGQVCSSGSSGSASSDSLGVTSAPRQSGFLSPAYIPAGYGSSSGSSHSGFGCEIPAVSTTFRSTDGSYLILNQRVRPLPAATAAWPPVDGTTLDDAHSQSEDGITRLIWRQDTIVALLESNALPLEELLRIAESTQLAP